MNLLEINKKLIGRIGAVGETNEDDARLENLKVMCDLVENLLYEIDNKSCGVANCKEMSMKRNGKYGVEFLNKIGFRQDAEFEHKYKK